MIFTLAVNVMFTARVLTLYLYMWNIQVQIKEVVLETV